MTIDQALQQAISHHKAGRLQDAERLYRAILQAQPNHPDANHNLGVLALQVKQPAAGLPHLKAALEANPNQGQYWLSYIDALIQTDQTDAARQVLAQGRQRGLQGEAVKALAGCLEGPSSDEINTLVVLFNKGRYTEGEALAKRLTVRFPQNGFGWKALGAVFKLQGRIVESLEPMQKAAELLPRDAEAHSNLGVTFHEQGLLTDAEESHRRALEIKPDYAVAHSNLGNDLQEQGRLTDAEACHRRALEIKPDYAEAHSNLGNTLREQGRFADAELSYRQALEIKPNYAEAHNNLGNVLQDQGRFTDAEVSYRRALEIKPDFAKAYNNLGNTLKEQGRLDEAEAGYRWALEIKPDFAEAHSNLLFAMGYTASHHLSDYLEEARRYGQMAGRKVENCFSSWRCLPQPERLRVGLVSGDLRNHPVGYFLESVLAQIDPSRIELIAYPTDHRTDELTARIKPYFSVWKSLVGLSDEAAARLIHADGVHLLLDLAGHTAKNRLPVFAWKPAPVQTSWLGYIATTGVAEMDYLLVDAISVPESQRGQFVETVWYLPDTRLCFTVPNVDVPVSDLPALQRGYLTFGCFQNLTKIGDRVLNLWGKILTAIPGSRLRLQCKQLADPAVQEHLIQRLIQHGIAPGRVFLQGVVSRDAYLAAHAEVDMILDSFPYPGGTTTCEGLWMGAPTLTLSGDSMLSRQGASLLTAAGLEDWIANSEEDYVNKAISLAANLPQLASLRQNLRTRLPASPLCDAPRFARHLETGLWKMWERWQNSIGTNRKQRRAAEKKSRRAIITPAIINANPVIPAKAGIQNTTGCRIKACPGPDPGSGMTTIDMFTCRSNNKSGQFPQMSESAAPQSVPAPSSEEIEHLVTLFNQCRYAEAETLARKITESFPIHGFGWKALGAIRKLQGRSAEALEPMQKAAALLPEDAAAHSNLGNTLQEQGRLTDAEASCRRALEIKPDFAEAHNNLGITLKDLGRLNDAEASYRRALEIKPDYAEAYNNLGVTLKEQGRFADAEASYRRALEIKPDYAEAHGNLGVTLQDLGRMEEAEALYRRALEINPDFTEAHSNLLFTLNYAAGHHLSYHLEEACRYGQMVSRKVGERFSAWLCEAQPERLRVGLVSGDLRNHPVGFFLESVLAQINPSRIELIAYPTDIRVDELTARIKPYFSVWKSLVGLNDEAAARLIHADGVHILIDLAGHTAHNRLPVFARKPAPVQATWLGYLATTGVAEMDYLLGDHQATPPENDGHFSEKVWRLPEVWACLTPPDAALEVSQLPALSAGCITFGCFNNLSKMNDAVVALWARVLQSVPASRLFLKTKKLDDPAVCETTLQRFTAQGIESGRLMLEGSSPRAELLAAYNRVDIALDPFPYGGGTTSFEVLWMAVPIITRKGDRFLSRCGQSLAFNADLVDWIAEDDDDYVAKAVMHTQDLKQLAALRAGLRERVLASPLFDAPRFARHLEAALREMWERWELTRKSGPASPVPQPEFPRAVCQSSCRCACADQAREVGRNVQLPSF